MTEDVLDKLRTHAARMHDEASRLVRALKGSNANEEQVREHLGNVGDAAAKARAVGWPEPVTVPFVQVESSVPAVSVAVTTTPIPSQPVTVDMTESRRKGRGKANA